MTNKRAAASTDAPPAKKAKNQYKKKLIDLAKNFEAPISLPNARKLWEQALDGVGVTPKEFETLAHILDSYKFTKPGRTYLDALVTKHESGTSMYITIDKVKYDRSCVDLAAHLNKDNKLSLDDARLLWKDVLDGPGVTPVEKRTIEYVMTKYADNLSKGAKKFLKDNLKAWETAHASGVANPNTTVESRSRARRAVASSGGAAAAVPVNGGWHGHTGFGHSGRPQVKRDYEFDMGSKAYGLSVGNEFVYAGDESGLVVKLDLEGNSKEQYRLPTGVKCMVSDDGFLFAGTNNGSLYDLTSGVPRLVAELEDFQQVLWLDIHQGIMAASDAAGNVALVNCEGETLWKKKSAGTDGWMVRVDGTGVYHGHSKGVTKYDHEGNVKWDTPSEGVLFGWQQGTHLYAGLIEPNCFDGEIAKRLQREGAKTGEVVASLMWNSVDDLDMHVHFEPKDGGSKEHICYMAKRSASGGELDVDMNAGWGNSTEPVENIYWRTAPAGKYRVSVIDYSHRSAGDVPYEVHLNVRGEKKKIEGVFKKEEVKNEKIAFEFELEPTAGEAATGALAQQAVIRLCKETGKLEKTFTAGSTVASTTTTPDESRVFAAVPNAIKCFNAEGNEEWNLETGNGSAMTLQYSGADKLYAVCRSRVLCMDVSPAAIDEAKKGGASAARVVARDTTAAETAVTSSTNIESTSDASGGIRVDCVKQGSKIRVRPAAGQAGYDHTKNIQFPRNIREDGASFIVDGLKLAGSFYRVQGNIRKLTA